MLKQYPRRDFIRFSPRLQNRMGIVRTIAQRGFILSRLYFQNRMGIIRIIAPLGNLHVCLALAEVESKRAKARQVALAGTRPTLEPHGSKVETGGTAEIIAKKLGIGENTVQRAIKVKKQGIPEVFKAVEDGRVTVNEGARIVDLKPHAQKQIVQLQDKNERKKVLGTRLQQSRSSKALREHRQTSGDAYVPGTPYVKRFLARAEMMLNDLISESKSENPLELADKFLREMDWSSEPLRTQYQHCEKLFACIVRVHSGISANRSESLASHQLQSRTGIVNTIALRCLG